MRYAHDPHGRERVTRVEVDVLGPELLGATRRVLDAAGAVIAPRVCQADARDGARACTCARGAH